MLIYFSLTLFVSATLLFLVQPMIGRMILPQLGGTPAVWNTCMVFFQGVLLVGYGYTHLLTTTQPTRRQVLIQCVMLCFPFLVLPFALGNWEPPPESNPIFSLTWKLILMVGLPFFAVSTTAPLLQKWFVHTGHPAAKDPYFLYGASNLGSMLGLALYPTVLEPWLPVAPVDGEATYFTQVHLWTAGFALFGGLVVGCAVVVWKGLTAEEEASPASAPATAPQPSVAPAAAITATPLSRRAKRIETAALVQAPISEIALPTYDDNITLLRRLRWIGLAAAPSSLMLGVTTYMTTDIAAVAFFWILPLALYLMTFIMVFARWPTVWTGQPHLIVLFLQPCFVLFLVLKLVAHLSPPTWAEFLLHLAAFFSTTLMCHGELAKDRPSTKHLTEFYFWMSLGGVLGGLFNAFFAPIAFQHGIWEYPIAIACACLLRANLVEEVKTLVPGDSTATHPTKIGYALDGSVPILIGILGYFMAYVGDHYYDSFIFFKRSYLLAALVVGVLALSLRPIRFGLSVGTLLFAITVYDRANDLLVYEGRGFFGLLRVRETEPGWYRLPAMTDAEAESPVVEWKAYRSLIHGGINHGTQIVEYKDRHGNQNLQLTLKKRREPITYFHERNGVAEIYSKFSWPDVRLPASMVGLMGGEFATLGMLANTQSEPPYAVVGLGTGILAAYARPFQTVHFYEIDPLVRNLSIPPDGGEPVFYYLHDAKNRGASIDVKMGDGRLKIKEAPENYYHIISLDAFSSDAIPVHLLTAEAVDLYMSKLAEGGVLIFNTTNRFVRIEGVLSAIARKKGYDCLACPDYGYDRDSYPGNKEHPDRYSADWVVLQRKTNMESFKNGMQPIDVYLEKERKRLSWDGRPLLKANGDPIIEERWQPVTPLPGPIWTDSYSNLLNIMRWK